MKNASQHPEQPNPSPQQGDTSQNQPLQQDQFDNQHEVIAYELAQKISRRDDPEWRGVPAD